MEDKERKEALDERACERERNVVSDEKEEAQGKRDRKKTGFFTETEYTSYYCILPLAAKG